MSRFKSKRRRLKKFKQVMKSFRQKASDPALCAEADKIGIPRCPDCNSSLLCWFTDSIGDYYWCLNCGAAIPVGFENGT